MTEEINWVWNWPVCAVIIFIIVMAIIGYKKGFAKMILSMLSVVIAVAVIWIFGGLVSDLVVNHTKADEKISEKIEAFLEEHTEADDEIGDVIDRLRLPAFISNKLKAGAESMTEKTKEMADYLARVIVKAGTYIGLFIVILILEMILIKVMDLITKLPVIHELNGLLGLGVSLLEAWLLLSIIFLLLTTLVQSEWGRNVLAMIRENPLTLWLYDHNILLKPLT